MVVLVVISGLACSSRCQAVLVSSFLGAAVVSSKHDANRYVLYWRARCVGACCHDKIVYDKCPLVTRLGVLC